MYKPLAAFIAALTIALPAVARVEPGTSQLLQTLEEYGVSITYNPPTCGNGFLGMYNTRKEMTLCYRGAPNADAHDIVRHEAFHFIQHCAAQRRRQNGITPLAVNSQERHNWVLKVLGSQRINGVKDAYDTKAHQVELEAFAAASHYTSSEIVGLIKAYCIK
jgi:hypothetical protein